MNKRQFLKSLLAASAGMSSYTALGQQLSLLNAVSNTSSLSGYKALVCIFLYGGNDSYNMLVPTAPSEYQIYSDVRQNLALAQDSLLPLTTTSTLPYAVGVPDYMQAIADLFGQGQLAFVNNVGPLVEPTVKSQIENGSAKLPPQLFSHNDQQSLWQTASSNLGDLSGWAGRMADLLSGPESQPVSMNISLAGNNITQTGSLVQPYSVNADGVQMFDALNPEQQWNSQRIGLLDQLMATDNHALGNAYQAIMNRARTSAVLVNQALASGPALETTFGDDPLSQELAMTAKLISVRSALNMNRQTFFIGYGGWDTHDRQLQDHPRLLATLGDALVSLNAALNELGLSDSVTVFTASDFGRTLTSNGDGTDHGWGGHQLVMGGAVQGGQFYGTMPALALGSNDDVGDGRMLPTTATEEYFAQFARWFGLTDAEIALVFPTLSRFNQDNLDFLATEPQ